MNDLRILIISGTETQNFLNQYYPVFKDILWSKREQRLHGICPDFHSGDKLIS